MNGGNRYSQSNQRVIFLCRLLVVALAVALSALGTARADKIFAHGAAGTGDPFSFKTEIVLGSNFVSANLLVPATGVVRFFRPNGTPMQLRVNGPIAPSPGCAGNLCTSFNYSVIGPTQFILESDNAIENSTFWTRVEEDQQDMTRATLKFVLLQGATEVSVADVPPSDARERHGFFVTGPINPGQTRLTGIAISNPSGAQARYAAVALDEMGNQAATAEFFLAANQQTALFVNELFVDDEDNPVLPADFNGSVQVLSDRDSSSVALLQTLEDLGGGNFAITISAIRTDDESAEPIPFLVGKAAEFGGDEPGGGIDLQVIAASSVQPRGQLGGGAVTLTRGEEILRGTIAPDGSILIGPVEEGEWILNLQVPGFLPFERPIDFPATPFDIDLIPLALINPAWFEETLGPGNREDLRGRVFRPRRQFSFIFDTGSLKRVESNSARENIQKVRDAFKQWVIFELRGLQMTVFNNDGGLTLFGGRAAFSEVDFGDVPDGIALDTIIISADPSLNGPLGGGTLFDDDTFEVNGSTLLFNPGFVISPSCDPAEDNVCDVPRIISAFFWNTIFLRQFNGVDVDLVARPISGLPGENGLLSSVFTQITANPQSFASSALDRNYWRVLARRPPGTLITADGEFLPKAKIPNAQQSLSSKQRKAQLKLLPFYQPKQ